MLEIDVFAGVTWLAHIEISIRAIRKGPKISGPDGTPAGARLLDKNEKSCQPAVEYIGPCLIFAYFRRVKINITPRKSMVQLRFWMDNNSVEG